MTVWKITIRDEHCTDTKTVRGSYDEALKVARQCEAAGWTVEEIGEE